MSLICRCTETWLAYIVFRKGCISKITYAVRRWLRRCTGYVIGSLKYSSWSSYQRHNKISLHYQMSDEYKQLRTSYSLPYIFTKQPCVQKSRMVCVRIFSVVQEPNPPRENIASIILSKSKHIFFYKRKAKLLFLEFMLSVSFIIICSRQGYM